jgi:uncharacterized membrane protein
MLRSNRERFFQSLFFEIGGLLVATPLYHAVFGGNAGEALTLLLAISFACILWGPLHDALFDRCEWAMTRRLSSDRPSSLRLVHATSREVSPCIVTLPIFMLLGGHDLVAALAAEIWLTLIYIAYGYAFYRAYDWLRPMPAAPFAVEAEAVTLR